MDLGPNSPVVNGASIDYQFMAGPNLPLVSRNTTSNSVSTQINSGEIALVKSVDKTFATIGDTISYTITLSNPGNVTSQNIIFTDILPDGTTFISGTLVNDSGTQQIGNPANGIQIGNINPSGMAVITINALVINIPSINQSLILVLYNFSILLIQVNQLSLKPLHLIPLLRQ